MLCPLKLINNTIPEAVQIKREVECEEENCAWWISFDIKEAQIINCCAVLAIALKKTGGKR